MMAVPSSRGLVRPMERRRAGIVAIEPVGVGLSAHPAVLDRQALGFADPLDARGLVPAVGLGGIVELRKTAAEDGAILDRHGAAGRHEPTHRMAGIAEQHDASAAPAVVALTIE